MSAPSFDDNDRAKAIFNSCEQAFDRGREVGYQAGYVKGWNDAANSVKSAFAKVIKESTPRVNSEMPLCADIEPYFGVRIYTCLKRSGYDTIRSIVCATEEELKAVPYLGTKGVDEIITVIGEHGYKLAPDMR